MPLAAELELPQFDHTNPELRGDAYRNAMASLEAHDGWLAGSPFGYIVIDREAGEFFLRTRKAAFPGLTIAELFGINEGPLHEEIVRNIINAHGDEHRRLRNLVNPALSPKAVARHRPAMRRFLADLFAVVEAAGECDFIADIAKPYPSLVIAHVMGAPLEDAPRLYDWSNWIQRQFDAVSLMTERAQIEQAVREFYEYADALIDERRTSPGEDLISSLIAAEGLTAEELRNLVLNILVGGVDTSQSQLAHAVRLLAEHPAQWEALRQNPGDLAGAAVEEALRHEPITPLTARIVISELEYRGVTFPAGSVVLVSAWHANREGVNGDGVNRERVDSDRFDIRAHRDGRVLTFGAGIHYCVGANLARAEMQEGLIFLAERVRTLALAGEPEYGTPSGIYGLGSLPLKLELA